MLHNINFPNASDRMDEYPQAIHAEELPRYPPPTLMFRKPYTTQPYQQPQSRHPRASENTTRDKKVFPLLAPQHARVCEKKNR